MVNEFFSSIPFYFTRLVLLTFSFVFLLPRMQSFNKYYLLSSSCIARRAQRVDNIISINLLIVLSFIGTKHYHYLMPLVPLLALNIARRLYLKHIKFACCAGVMFVLYLLGACTLYFKRYELLDASFCWIFYGNSFFILCFYIFFKFFLGVAFLLLL